MRVCHISTVHSTFDDRIFYKECISLHKNEYEVFLVVKNKVKFQTERNINIVGLKDYKNRASRFLFGAVSAFYKALKTHSLLYHIHDPELIPAGMLLKLCGKKVIFDVHEMVLFQIEDKHWISSSLLKKTFQHFYKISEKIAVRLFDGLVFARKDISDYFIENYKLKSDTHTVLENYPIIALFDNVAPVERQPDKNILIYVGGMSRIRAIKEIVQSMEYTDDKTELWLLGEFNEEAYYNECIALEGWKKVKYLGFKRLEEVYRYMAAADICLVFFYPLKNHLRSNPNKSFEYMAMAKPMIVSGFDYWKQIYRDIALFADPYNPVEIAQKINSLIENREMRKVMGIKARQRVEQMYSWESEQAKLISLYNKILK